MANVFIIRTMNSCASFVYFLFNSPAYHKAYCFGCEISVHSYFCVKFNKNFSNTCRKYLQNFIKFGIVYQHCDGSIAQLGEHLPYKQGVIGSSPITSTNTFIQKYSAELSCGNGSGVERHLAKVNVASSNLVSRSTQNSALIFWRYSQVVRQGSAKP